MTVSSCSLDVGLATPTELMAMQVMLQQQAGGEQGGGVGWGEQRAECVYLPQPSFQHTQNTARRAAAEAVQSLHCAALQCSSALQQQGGYAAMGFVS